MSQNSPRVIALVGMPGSGKSVCAKHLEARGFFQFRFGSIVVDEVKRRGLAITPQNERLVREEFRANEGMDVMAKRALPILQDALNHHQTVIADGLYSFKEYKTLRNAFGNSIVMIAIITPRQLRYKRLSERTERPLTYEEAEERDFAEIENLEKGGPIALADYALINAGDMTQLVQSLDHLLEELNVKP